MNIRPAMNIRKVCPQCGKPFTAQTSRKVYCNRLPCQRKRRNEQTSARRAEDKFTNVMFQIAATLHNQGRITLKRKQP